MERQPGGGHARGRQRAAAAGHGVVPAGRALPPRRRGVALHAAVGRPLVPGAPAPPRAAPAPRRAAARALRARAVALAAQGTNILILFILDAYFLANKSSDCRIEK